MINQYTVRYGRNYKVGLAIVLPSFLLIPFIYLLAEFKSIQEWLLWLIIFGFLGFVISLSLWLVFRVYPIASLNLNHNEISLIFKRSGFPGPSNFSFFITDVDSFTQNEIGGAQYCIIKTRNPFRKFQISSASNSLDDTLSFEEARVRLNEMMIKRTDQLINTK